MYWVAPTAVQKAVQTAAHSAVLKADMKAEKTAAFVWKAANIISMSVARWAAWMDVPTAAGGRIGLSARLERCHLR